MLVFVMTSLSITAGLYSSQYSVIERTSDCLTIKYVAKGGFKAVDKYNTEIELPIQPYNMRNSIFQDTDPMTEYKDYVFKTDDCIIDYYAHIKKDGYWSYVKKSSTCKVIGEVKKGYKVRGREKYDYLLYGKIIFNSTFDYPISAVQYSGSGKDAVATFKFCKKVEEPAKEIKELSLSLYDIILIIIKDTLLRIKEVFKP